MKVQKKFNFMDFIQLAFLGLLFPFTIGIVYTAAQTDNFAMQYLELCWILIFCGFAAQFVLSERKIKIHYFIVQLALFALLVECSISLNVNGISLQLALAISAICISIMSLHNTNRSL